MTTASESNLPITAKSTSIPRYRRRLTAVNWRLLISSAALLALFVALFSYVQYGSPALVGTDGYYHAKMGYLVREQGLRPGFPWLPMTILNPESFSDHHLLYHAYLALFAGTDPAVDGGLALTSGTKVASVIMPALAFLAIWWLLRGQKVRWAAVWTLGLFAVSEAFLYRMSMPRAQSASLLVLALSLHWLLTGRYKLLAPLGFVYVWLYDAFPLLLVVGGSYLFALLLTERRFVWQALFYPAVGIVLGLLINPYFPSNLNFIIRHVLPKIGETSTGLGNEWYPYETWTLVKNSGLALAAFLAGMFAWSWRKERITPQALTVFALTVFFALLLFRSRRFVEYFPAFALIFAVISTAPLVNKWLSAGNRRYGASAVLLIILCVAVATTLIQARESVGNSKPAEQYAGAASWLGDNAIPGSMVFQTDWDDFARLFFYNDESVYTLGLDPTYMELYDADLYDEWRRITLGKVNKPGTVIRDSFGASYIFSDLKHESFLEEAADDPLLHEVYRDDNAVIYSVRE